MNQENINNDIYHNLGEKWYTAKDDPIALLRAESKFHIPWVLKNIKKSSRILDVGCGGGFFTNPLAEAGHDVTGVDISEESLLIAKEHDRLKKVKYIRSDARSINLPDASFDVIISMDFLEHIKEVDQVINEVSRLLVPGGLFFYHTFNRNPISHLLAIKFVEWFVKNTPPDIHVISLFIKPEELRAHLKNAGLTEIESHGLRPTISNMSIPEIILTGRVPDRFGFKFCNSKIISYSGIARKLN